MATWTVSGVPQRLLLLLYGIPTSMQFPKQQSTITRIYVGLVSGIGFGELDGKRETHKWYKSTRFTVIVLKHSSYAFV